MKRYVIKYRIQTGVALLGLIVLVHIFNATGYYDLAHRKLTSFFINQTFIGKPDSPRGPQELPTHK